jgi:hypothetical protein
LDLTEALEHLRGDGFHLVIIDTPPAITVSISQAIAHADLVILPTRPSPHDLRALGETVTLAERYQKPLVFVLNGATPRARITGESAVALAQHGTAAPTFVHHRIDFAASMVDGRTVGEVAPRSASAKEICALWTYVEERLPRVKKAVQALPAFQTDDLALDLPPVADSSHDSTTRPVFAAAAGSPSVVDSSTAGEPAWLLRAPGNQNDIAATALPEPVPVGLAERHVAAFGKRNTVQLV